MQLNYTWLPASAPNFNDEILQIIAAKNSYLIDQNGNYTQSTWKSDWIMTNYLEIIINSWF